MTQNAAIRKRGNPPFCHPERAHQAKGMCQDCYNTDRYNERRGSPRTTALPVCHPNRKYHANAMCRECYMTNYYSQNKESIRNKQIVYNKSNKEHFSEYYAKWREDNREYTVQYDKSNLEHARDGHLKRTYNITTLDYDRMLTEQKGVCAGCHVPSSKRLHVDHDHATGIVRGLLCQGCNKALGFIYDNPVTLISLAEYLMQDEERCSG